MSRASLTITRGVPGSGKTTWAKGWVGADPENRARVNRDDLRLNLYGRPAPLDYKLEQAITVAQHAAVRALLEAGKDVVVDDCHVRSKYVTEWGKIAADAGADFEVYDAFAKVPLETAIARDLLRPTGHGRVGEQVIRDMHARLASSLKSKPAPAVEAEVPTQYVPNPDLPVTWLVDIDGTLALMGDRHPFDWSTVGYDKPNIPVLDLVSDLHGLNYRIVVVSGRDSVCRVETEDWLSLYGIHHDGLHMRAAGDNRSDEIVKRELFEEIAKTHCVVGVLDDRDKVVKMWRALGLLCLQVAPGAF